MFAKQIAVMKGQAWNVVETLKQPDHGPLELTRRMRVCVWDDKVDIPIAIPLRGASSEMQRRRQTRNDYGYEDAEEMDISTAISTADRDDGDLMSLGSPTSELPNPNRFELSRSRPSTEVGSVSEGDVAGRESGGHHSLDKLRDGRDLAQSWASPPSRPRKLRADSEFLRRDRHDRRLQQGSKSNRRVSNPWTFNGDDLEGDLGYAAAEGMEGNERKVIVERLEAVKSKNPVFTWC